MQLARPLGWLRHLEIVFMSSENLLLNAPIVVSLLADERGHPQRFVSSRAGSQHSVGTHTLGNTVDTSRVGVSLADQFAMRVDCSLLLFSFVWLHVVSLITPARFLECCPFHF